jgi:predicted TIM-barrel fold metal-dependent hydrolase
MLKPDLPYSDDPEGACIPSGCGRVIDAHVHVFPDNIFSAIWNWFDTHAWKIRYRMSTGDILQLLLDKGMSHVIALQYAHKPGIAEMLNNYLANEIAAFKGQVSGMATVFPGEPMAGSILKRAFSIGLTGVKLHAHVQCFDMNAPYMDDIYQVCSDENKPLVMHVGTEPKSEAYACDPYQLCRAEKLEQVLKAFPDLKICVPHLGFGEIDQYRALIETYDNLWTDTTMVVCDYFPVKDKIDLTRYRMDRIMYGSDFPNIPYEWDRELKVLAGCGLAKERLDRILYQNAAAFFGING